MPFLHESPSRGSKSMLLGKQHLPCRESVGRKESRKQETLIGAWGKTVDSSGLDRSFQSIMAPEKANTQRLCVTEQRGDSPHLSALG